MGNIRRLVALTALMLLGSPLAPIPAQAGTGSVSGTVIDDDTGGPATGVQIVACEAECRGSAITDASGHYQLDGIPSNSWNVVANLGTCGASTYAPAHKYGVRVTDGATTTLDLHTTRRMGAITGRVLDSSGAPIPDVQVVVDNAEAGGFGLGGATSAADGTYTVSCLAAAGVAGAGTYYVTAIPPASAGFGQQQDAGIVVRPGGSVKHDLVLKQAAGSISGRVTCAGKPCNAAIMVYCEGCSSSALSQANSNGRYQAVNLQPGHRYDVHAVGPAGWDNGIHYGVQLAGGSATADLNLVAADAAHSGRLTGTIHDAAGAPTAGCLINAFGGTAGSPEGGWVDGDVHTAANGSYDTGYRLAPGDYGIFLDCPGWAEVRIDGGKTVHVAAGGPTVAGYSLTEPGRPYRGGSDVVGAAAPATQAYFAEGSTQTSATASFHEYFAIQNPGAAQTLTVRYYLTGGIVPRAYALAAHSRTTINVNAEAGANQGVAAWLSAPQPFTAERSMYFFYPGGISGGDATVGATSLSTTAYFAEGYTGPGFHESLQLFNPDPRQVATALVTYFFAGSKEPKTVSHAVPAASRLTLDVADPAEAGPNQAVSMLVMSDFPLLSERTIYFQTGRESGGSVVVGATHPSQHLDLAEGFTGNGFTEDLALFNPNESDATATISYRFTDGQTVTRTVTLPAESRQTRLVNADLPAGTAAAVHIDADQPLVVERPMYFTTGGRAGGHVALAVDEAEVTTSATFAEGYQNHCGGAGCFDESFSLLNVSDQAATITLTYFTSSGAVEQRTFTAPPKARLTRSVADDLPNGTTFSARFSSDRPIVVERVSYFSY
jgi:hypothetical protein